MGLELIHIIALKDNKIYDLQREIINLKQQMSGDTPTCYGCGEKLEFNGLYSKYTKEVEEPKIINVCEGCF